MATSSLSQVLRDFGEAIALLRKRRRMYIGEGIQVLTAFIVGYSVATKNANGVDLMQLLQDHTKDIYKARFSMVWFHYLTKEVAKGDEDLSTELVFDTIADFVSRHGIDEAAHGR